MKLLINVLGDMPRNNCAPRNDSVRRPCGLPWYVIICRRML